MIIPYTLFWVLNALYIAGGGGGGISSYTTNTGDRNLSDIIILICVLKMKACFMGLERHEGFWQKYIFFWWTVPLRFSEIGHCVYTFRYQTRVTLFLETLSGLFR